MSARINWHTGVPHLARRAAEPSVKRYATLLPGWVEEFRVAWDDGDDSVAEIAVVQEYRYAQMTLRPAFLTATETMQEECILHEILHAALMPMKTLSFRIMDAVGLEEENPALYRWACELAREANEGAVQDLTGGLRRMGGKKAA